MLRGLSESLSGLAQFFNKDGNWFLLLPICAMAGRDTQIFWSVREGFQRITAYQTYSGIFARVFDGEVVSRQAIDTTVRQQIAIFPDF